MTTLPKTLTVWYVYVKEVAYWKIRTVEDEHGQPQHYDKRAFQTLQDLQESMQARVPAATIVTRLDHRCEREQHSLRLASAMAMAQDQTTVFVRCACGLMRQVPVEAWRAIHRGDVTE